MSLEYKKQIGAKSLKKPQINKQLDYSINNLNKSNINYGWDNILERATTYDEIANAKVRWILPDRIAFSTIVMLFAEAGTGKSLVSTHLAYYLLDNKRETGVKNVIYLDFDNGMATLNDRNIQRIIGRKKH
ncbi:AAA family ATPase [Campylobacter suis]|uniref:AAA domain-containing protein n=1 Tax=Campylobacter suis TaxID=2790657 RepID=A0ABM8Q229_9BACT|nr:AAA family ATPase [Campylobacter suis]CAD7286889.1 hypothetical protein LMG8286_00591 [Campylobacter suis]